MKKTPEDLLLEELAMRTIKRFDASELLFKEQLDFIRDPAPFKTGVCSRRSGKTVSCATDLLETASNTSGVVCLYITLSRSNAKKIIWPELQRLNREYELGGHVSQAELNITLPNGSVVYISGAKDKAEIEKFRGLPLKLCYIDECQSFRQYIRELIDDVIAAALMDYAGTLCLIGTPAPVPSGYFFECAQSETWSHHAWTFWQNPHLVKKSGMSHDAILDRELTRRGVTKDNPSIRREFFGEWVLDSDNLVYKYRKDINNYDEVPNFPKPWRYVVGVDLGLYDADAIAVIGYNENCEKAYLVEEDIASKQGITELATKLQKIINKYNPDIIVADTGGLGAKIAEEITRRWDIPIIAAEKQRKNEFIELMNDSLRTGKLMAKEKSAFAQDCMLVEWNMDKSNADKRVVSDRYHSDITDAVLYAFRASYHWLSQPAKYEPEINTQEWLDLEVAKMEEAASRNMNQDKFDDPWEQQIPFESLDDL